MRNLLIGLGVGYTVRAVRSSLVYKAAVKGDKEAEDLLSAKISDKMYEFAFGEKPKNPMVCQHFSFYASSAAPRLSATRGGR